MTPTLPELDTKTPSLRTLEYVLRHPEHWPDGFVWDYGDCQSCGIGMAHRLWAIAGWHADLRGLVAAVQMDANAAERIFLWAGGGCSDRNRSITATYIADLIRDYLAQRGQ